MKFKPFQCVVKHVQLESQSSARDLFLQSNPKELWIQVENLAMDPSLMNWLDLQATKNREF